MQTERCCISYFSLKLLASSVKLKVFLTVTYFINSLFKRKSVKKLTQLSIKISKISYFSVPFKLSEKKVPLKKFCLESGVTRKFLQEGGGVGL